jgi:peptidoglycan-associated lipoprotein
MNRKSLLICAVLGLSAVLGITACGGKRKPNVLTQPGGGPSDRAGTARPPERAPEDTGPDSTGLGPEGGLGVEDITSVGTEGGPLADVHFAFNQSSLTDEARGQLEKHAAWLQTHRAVKVRIEGHCDERGTVEYNLALGDQRARVTKDYLVSLGVDAARLTPVSLGKERPLDPGHDEAAWQKNRRAHFAASR